MAGHFAQRLAAAAVVTLLLGGCSKEPEAPRLRAPVDATRAALAATSVHQLVRERSRESVRFADALSVMTTAFLADPGEASQAAMQSAWTDAHLAFSSLRPLIYVGGLGARLFDVDAWPMEPGFLDSLPRYPDSGIVNDFTLDVSIEVLREQHGITDTSEVSLGFHPLEYYAHARPAEDFVASAEDGTAADTVERRRRAVSLIAADLRASIVALTDELEAALYVALPPDPGADGGNQVVRRIVSGLRAAAQHCFTEASLIVETDQGHGASSNSSRAILLAEAETLRAVLAPEGHLMPVLRSLDAEVANNLEATLDQAVSVLRLTVPGENERARLPLIFSAMNHQLEEFERLLPGDGLP